MDEFKTTVTRQAEDPSENIIEDNFQPEPESLLAENFSALYNKLPNLPWKKIAPVAIVIFLILGAVAFASTQIGNYFKYAQAIDSVSLLPADPNLVVSIYVNPDAEQYKMLEDNLQKFPGYDILKKKIDPVGQGKTISQALQDKLRQYNLDFEQDLRPALGDKASIAINDLSPLGNELGRKATLTLNNMGANKQKASTNQELALGSDISLPKVLGLSTENDPLSSPASVLFPKLDFIGIVPIIDLGKAEAVFKKIQSDKKYKSLSHSYGGYSYYEITVQPADGQDKPIFEKIYSAIMGKNLVVTSKEDDMKGTIDRANQKRSLAFMSRNSKIHSLADNADYEAMAVGFGADNQLLNAYFKLNFETFFKDKNCAGAELSTCSSVTDYIKYPQDIIEGVTVKSNSDGLAFDLISNKTNLSGVANTLFKDGLSPRIPQNVNNQWVDIFSEHSNLNDVYYNFKKNNLTDKGLKSWNDTLAEIKSSTGMNIETDIIDQIDGKSGLVVYTGANNIPKLALLVHVRDSQKMLGTIKSTVETMKQAYVQQLTASLDSIKKYKNTPPAMAADYRQQLLAIQNLNITEKDTPNGKMYYLNIPGVPVSLNFSLENSELVIGTHQDSVSALLATELKSADSPLFGNALFSRALQHGQSEGYTNSFITSQGIFNIINYVMQSMEQAFTEASTKAAVAQAKSEAANARVQAEMRDAEIATDNQTKPIDYAQQQQEAMQRQKDDMTAFGAVLRTIKFVGSTQSIQGNYVKASIFLDIKELPSQEKSQAEAILQKLQ